MYNALKAQPLRLILHRLILQRPVAAPTIHDACGPAWALPSHSLDRRVHRGTTTVSDSRRPSTNDTEYKEEEEDEDEDEDENEEANDENASVASDDDDDTRTVVQEAPKKNKKVIAV